MDAILWFCHIARRANMLLDRGESLDLNETKQHIGDESLLTWLDGSFPSMNAGLSSMSTADQARVYERFKNMALRGTEQKYGVSRNGLALVVAYCIQAIQDLHPVT
jgi:hypothetical protein